MVEKIKEIFFGKAKDPLDPQVFHNLSLTAFFAWVGLGADGLSSSCYGPEEAFLSLGHYSHLAILLAVAVAITVFVLSACYSQIIELFPSGGGGYLVATKLIGPVPGIISGSALLVDYILTVAISIAAGMDAIFSFLPPSFLGAKFLTGLIVLAFLITLNLRGIKESVLALTPIFITFVLTHGFIIIYGIFSHGENLHPLIVDTITETRMGIDEVGLWAMLFIFLRAFSLGGGTFTGIEAVSNGLQILREPRVKTAKKTMNFMALSLAFTAAGILVNYLLNNVGHTPGQTLNATLLHQLTDSWPWGLGKTFLLVTLISEGALLLVAAQAGFLDGPRVMSNMAADHWLPQRFRNLSDRLVIKDGIVMIGLAAMGMLVYTHGSVRILVVMYSINVFLTFSLSQFGMTKHWLKTPGPGRAKKLVVTLIGLGVTGGILIITASIKFMEGGWVTLVVTASLVFFCFWVRHHYATAQKALKKLDEILTNIPFPDTDVVPQKSPEDPVAILMVSGYNGIGIHSFLAIHKMFPEHFKNFIFLSVGVIDTDHFKDSHEVTELKDSIFTDLNKYVVMANKTGFYAESQMVMATNVNEGLSILCEKVSDKWNKKVFFTGQLVFENDSLWNRILHNQTAFSIQRKLIFKGMEVVILPIRVRL